MALTREQLLEAGKPRTAEVEIDGLGKVAVRQWTFREQQGFRELLRSDDHMQRMRAIPWAVAQCVLDHPGGSRLFTSESEIDALANLNGDVVSAIFDKIARFSDADAEAVKRAGEASAETSPPASS